LSCLSLFDSKMSEEFNLDEVLESALEDFEDDEKKQQKLIEVPQEIKSTTPPSVENKKEEVSTENNVSEGEIVDEVKKLMDSLSHGEFDKTLEEITKAIQKGEIPDFKDLNIDNIESLNEEMLEKFAEEFENKEEMQNIMTNMMSQLVSKDMLYEPMKEISTKYPEWLSTNKDKISVEEYKRYCKHAEYVEEICRVYENEPANTDKVVNLMQQMQEYGQPPLDMMKSLAPDLEFNEDGTPSTNSLPDLLQNSELANNCSVM